MDVCDALAKALKSAGVDIAGNTDTSEGSESDVTRSSESGSESSDPDPHGFIQRAVQSTKTVTEPAENPRKRCKRRRGWKKRKKLPFRCSMFYRDYNNPDVRVAGHMDAKEFRANYRMPWSEVRKIVELFVARGWVLCASNCKKQVNLIADSICPPEIKVLATLYWLGEGYTFRTIYNLSGRVLSRQSFTKFAKKFCKIVHKQLSSEYIRIPRNVSELHEVSAQYKLLGFPGACGSTDGVQIAWEGCPFAYRHSFKGKEKYPTLGFNVTVAHNMRILHVYRYYLCINLRQIIYLLVLSACFFSSCEEDPMIVRVRRVRLRGA